MNIQSQTNSSFNSKRYNSDLYEVVCRTFEVRSFNSKRYNSDNKTRIRAVVFRRVSIPRGTIQIPLFREKQERLPSFNSKRYNSDVGVILAPSVSPVFQFQEVQFRLGTRSIVQASVLFQFQEVQFRCTSLTRDSYLVRVSIPRGTIQMWYIDDDFYPRFQFQFQEVQFRFEGFDAVVNSSLVSIPRGTIQITGGMI